jgi:hypothetical protein
MLQARLAATAALFVLLGGCASTGHQLGHLSPPDLPTASAIRSTYVTTLQGFGGTVDANPTITPPLYVQAGYRYVDDQCNAFFISLAQAQRLFSLTRKETVLGLSTANTVLALAKTKAATLAYVAAGGVLLTNSLDNTNDYVVLTQFTSQLEKIVQPTRDVYKSQNPGGALTDDGPGKFQAAALVQGYAKLCTIDTLEGIITESLNQKVAVTNVDSGPMKAAIAAELNLDAAAMTDDDLRTLNSLLTNTSANRGAATITDKFPKANNSMGGIYWYLADVAAAGGAPAHAKGDLTTTGVGVKAGLGYLVPNLPAPAAK